MLKIARVIDNPALTDVASILAYESWEFTEVDTVISNMTIEYETLENLSQPILSNFSKYYNIQKKSSV
jgi:hypothetical protein